MLYWCSIGYYKKEKSLSIIKATIINKCTIQTNRICRININEWNGEESIKPFYHMASILYLPLKSTEDIKTLFILQTEL